MIVKTWPVKAGHLKNGVTKTLLYIQDDKKVVEIERDESGFVTRRTIIDTVEQAKKDAMEYFIENESDLSRVMEYVSNKQKIRNKYISGYLCEPETAEDDFYCAKHVTCQHAMKTPRDDDNEIQAFHIVQSFPEDLDISDEEVHQCGIELVERLGKYQAVIASHVHPIVDEEGEAHGRCKHNHIVINAYMHPEKVDEQHPERIKYASTQRDYAQLRFWNDEIAVEHGLPIIRNPDNERKFSWYEAEMEAKKTSWKGRVRLDIDEARRVTGSWDEFAALMERNGYKVLDRGTTVTFLCPDGQHKVRGKTLGRPYSREGLENYWALRDQVQREVQDAVAVNKNLTILELAIAKKGLTVAIPLGEEGLEHVQYHQIPLDRTQLSAKALGTYFRRKDHYDVCDAEGNAVAAFSGAELITWFKDNERLLKEAEKEEQAGRDPDAWKTSGDYYYNEKFRNSQTKEHYRVRNKDEDGSPIGLLRLMFILACVILKKEDQLWKPRRIPKDKENDPIYGRTDWKIQNMLDSLAVAREEGLESPADIEDRLQLVGATYSRIRASLRRTEAARDQMEPMAKAVKQLRETQNIAEKVLAMPAGPERIAAEKQYAMELAKYKEAKATLYRNGLGTPEKVAEFEQRYTSVCENVARLQEKFEDTKEDYRRLKKLQYNANLAQNAQYVYGPAYETERTAGDESSGDGKGKKEKEEQRE